MVSSLVDVQSLLTKGLLPENLPPVFNANQIWAPLSTLGTNYLVTGKCVGEHAIYNSSKRGGQRRVFSVPHPVFIRDQALFFFRNWPDIKLLFDGVSGSVSVPTIVAHGPRCVRITSHADLPKIRLKAFSRFKFCLVTDVSRFFPSVYTHTIPWATNGKVAAKTDTSPQSAAIYGNRLDFISRQSQSKQTIGIAVGPDTSKITAEILMSAVDKEFLRRSAKGVVFVRHVDDIWVAGNTHEECEKHLQNIRAALRAFELDINESKTKIISTKYVFGDSWPFEFDQEIREALSPGARRLGKDPVSTLSKIVDRAVQDNDDGIIRHAIRKIDDLRLWEANWDMLEHFLAQSAVQFPHAFDYVARVVVWRIKVARPVDSKLWTEVAKLTARQASELGRDSEVLWALWLLKELKVKIPKSTTDSVLAHCGALTLAFLAHCLAHGLVADRALKAKLWAAVEGDVFSGAFWPLALEMNHLSIGDPAWAGHTAQPPLRILFDAKVTLINWTALPKVFASEDENTEDDTDPDYAIEDYGSDYGNDTDEEGDESEETLDWPPSWTQKSASELLDEIGLGDSKAKPEEDALSEDPFSL